MNGAIGIKRQYRFIGIFLATLIVGCTNNVSPNKENSRDSLQLNNQANRKPSQTVYITHKQECGFDGTKSDSSFFSDASKVVVSISIECEGDYIVTDTSFSNDTCNVYAYKNQVVHITIKSNKEREVILKKDVVSKYLKNGTDLKNYLLGTTTIDSIAKDNRVIRFSTFMGFPQSDFGWYIIYNVTFEGELKVLKVVNNSED